MNVEVLFEGDDGGDGANGDGASTTAGLGEEG
jgi:hypothetical protein